jgi:gamma-glutamyl:cysteine ligase YbdK (ATP-grasp superfamily)
MQKIVKTPKKLKRKGLTTLQIKQEVLEKIKRCGRKDEDYNKILERLTETSIEIDKPIFDQFNKTAQSLGIEKKTLLSFGMLFIIILSSSGTLQHFQNIALSKNKSLIDVFIEFFKKFKM